ncbi:prefoldin subunit [Kwoniella mangroviensis CBS 10435]|uniref:Prefoldin subunit 3 n=1 Tax=Kwoniella mangroviensis CBS 10435 TaxID=1331196 RepID=A0A1B9IU19_9TREE|nr:prefoldin subunit [Kwoniella mangroviensis CBS 10435]OCF76713.1 prefoldin subunit [Kwoniella mangroviensis CBS 8886]
MATTSSSSKGQMETNPRGIPKAPFVADVDEYVGGKDAEIQSTMKKFEETTAKYRYMEISLQQRRKALLGKIPDMEQTLQVVKFLQNKEDKPLKTLFELNDTLFAEAEVTETGEVGLWLGANIMLMYPLQEAIELLTNKLSTAKKSHEETVEDLEFLREQITVMEVNFARVHNWDVKRRREKGLIGQQSGLLPSQRKQDNDDDDSDDDDRD